MELSTFRPHRGKFATFSELRAQISETKANTLIYIADRNIFSSVA